MMARRERRGVVDLCHLLAGQGYLAATGGNVALRIDAVHFAVTPSATDYYSMSAADVSVLRIDNLQQIEGERPPSVESGLHAKLLSARSDAGCSIHTHQPIASACALLGDELLVTDPERRALLGARVAVAGYAPSGTRWLSRKVAKTFRLDTNAYLMQNHGVLCCGPDARTAARAVAALEALAAERLQRRILLRARADSGRRQVLTDIADSLAVKFGSPEERFVRGELPC
jgi:L-fuculose-phosphate aldolase